MRKLLKKCLSILLVMFLCIPSNMLFVTERVEAAEIGATENTYEISYGVDSAWDGAFNAHINIKNVSDCTIKDWHLEFEMLQDITNIWNAKIVDKSNNKYLLENCGYNQSIKSGETISVGFTVAGNSEYEPYGLKILTGNYCEKILDESVCNIKFDVYSDWGNGFSGAIILSNISNEAIKNWSLEFDFNGTIDNLWNGSIISNENNHYKVENTDYNDLIMPGGMVTVGFNASRGNQEYPTNFLVKSIDSSSGDEKKTFKVLFECGSENVINLPEMQVISLGENAIEPNAPSLVGYAFNGWFIDSVCSTRFDFATPIEEDIILYAGWNRINDNLTDDIIDLGDIEYLRARGDVSVG